MTLPRYDDLYEYDGSAIVETDTEWLDRTREASDAEHEAYLHDECDAWIVQRDQIRDLVVFVAEDWS